MPKQACVCALPPPQVGAQRQFPFPVKDHVQLGEELGLIDFDTGAVVGLFHCHWAIVYSRWEHVDGVCVWVRGWEQLNLIDFDTRAVVGLF